MDSQLVRPGCASKLLILLPFPLIFADYGPSLPIGVGMVFSTITSGRMLDRDFRATRAKLERKRAKDSEGALKAAQRPLDPNDLLEFPLEHARLRLQPVCACFGSDTRSLS